jgi:hypothetical protein
MNFLIILLVTTIAYQITLIVKQDRNANLAILILAVIGLTIVSVL